MSQDTGADHRDTDNDNRVCTLCKSLVGHLPVVHLSFFDGIGVSSEALRRISDNVLLTLSWETNKSCADFTHKRFGSIQMGDVSHIDIDKTVAYVEEQMGKQEFIVLVTAGPPCPDFSRIRKSPKGADGESGWLFQHMIDIEYQLRLKFQGRPFETVIENVLPHNSLREHLLEMTDPLCMSPIVIDAADGGLVHRKRLWWTSIDWPDVEAKLSRHTPWSTSWKMEDDWSRLHNPIAADLQAPLQHKGFSLPNCLQQNNKLFHCLTTPSQHYEGRPMPQTNRSRPSSPSTTKRWQDDHQRYPPWQYEEQFLTQWPDGSFSTAPTELREQLQGLPVGYTEALAGGDQTQRDVALGNAWHLPTTVWILFLVLLGTANADVPRSPHESALDKVVNLWTATRVPFGPPPRRSGSEYMPQFSWTEHLDWALHRDTNMTPKDLDPTLNWCLEHRHLFHPLVRFQHDVIEEIKELVLEFEDHTMAWFHTLPPHVQHAYKHKESVTQIPILIHLLRRLQYPQTEVLYRELSDGFPLMGKLTPGVNWHVRQDQKYLQPTPIDDFRQKNREYIRNKLENNRVDDHWKFMLDEILAEVKLGRMNGPFKAPKWWPRPSVATQLPGTDVLLDLPHDDPFIAMAFSIEQTGSDGNTKIRRGEDWRRSGHNSTCIMHDQPYHHTPDHFVSLGLAFLENNRSTPLRVWGHDHDGAYRQLPLNDPRQAYVLLLTPDGPTLWSHNVLLFGSAASVWSYNRFGDVLVACSRTLVLSPALHYVDDYGSMEDELSADSSFRAFEDYNGCLRISMKPSKRQPPEKQHRIQGVLISSDTENLILTPCPARVRAMTQQIEKHLDTNVLTPEEARKMAGKCNFLTGRLFGKVGRAPLKAIYARANSFSHQLDKPTRSSLMALRDIILHCQPMTIPRNPTCRSFSVIYTDAYFQLKGTVYRPGDENLPQWDSQQTPDIENGWAALCFHQGDVHTGAYFQGRLPSALLRQFSADQAFIYLLEAWAAILAPMIFEPWLDRFYVQCCDNEASRHALIKGVGKHQPLNCLISAHWTWHNRRGIAHRLERVPTKANISDALSRFEGIPEAKLWHQLQIPTSSLTQRATKIIGDIEFASKRGFEDVSGVKPIHDFLRKLAGKA